MRDWTAYSQIIFSLVSIALPEKMFSVKDIDTSDCTAIGGIDASSTLLWPVRLAALLVNGCNSS
jgi:hypothetical protein